MEHILEVLAHEHGVLVRRDHPTLTGQIDHARKRGMLQSILPGIYTAPDPDWITRARAATAFRPGCVITGAAAARLLWWPEAPLSSVAVAVPHAVSRPYPMFTFGQRRLPADLIVERDEMRIACPQASILDLIPTLGGEVIDQGLRRRSTTLADLWEALRQQPDRPLNPLRARLLHDSRDEPWSEAERHGHHLLRQGRIAGWRTNYRIVIDGVSHYADIAFPQQRVIVEIDGYAHHGTRAAFIADRWRYARLAAAGWRVLPFAASALDEDPDGFLVLVRRAVGAR